MKKENWQKILGIIAILTFLFGSGIVYRFCSDPENSLKGYDLNNQASQHNLNRSEADILKNDIEYLLELELGEQIIIKYEYEDIEINFKELSKSNRSKYLNSDSVDAVLLEFDVGGGLVYGGELTNEVNVNQFLMIEKQNPEEELYSVYKFIAADEYFSFFRIYVEHINVYKKSVRLNLYFTDRH